MLLRQKTLRPKPKHNLQDQDDTRQNLTNFFFKTNKHDSIFLIRQDETKYNAFQDNVV